jgi:VWFA-related protein
VADKLTDQEGRQAIVLLTDGYDEHSTRSPEEAIEAVKRLHAPLYVIGIAGSAGISLKGEQFLRGLASATGGRAFFPSRDSQYGPMNRRVAEDVQQRYLLAYTPTNQRADGAWRRIALAVSNDEWVVRSRGGYFAPKPPPVRPSIEFTMMSTDRELLAVGVEDLLVREDGVEQAVDTFEEAVSPVAMVLAMDGSGSMKKAAAAVQSAARMFVDAIRPEDRLSVATFATSVWFHHEFSTNRDVSHRGIDQYVARGGTALYDALFYSFTRLRALEGRRVVVVLTDGRDENAPGTAPGSVHTIEQVLDLMRQSDVTVFAIGLGPTVDQPVLERLADESGGESYFPSDVSELDAQYRRVVENLRRRYVISYTSTNAKRDGAWRTVEIVSRIPGTTTASKRGYFAPGN